jgi:glycosyltransferase involved in cell wall biosynthesis
MTYRGTTSRARTPKQPPVPLIVCAWNRPHRLPITIESLASQSYGPLRLYLWNNNRAIRETIDEAVADASGLDLHVIHSARNVGGFGRFFVARQIAHEHPFVVFLDDDQDPSPEAIETLVGEFRPATAWSPWGFHFRGRERYWDRDPARAGQRVKYCGTGGMICDSRAFVQPSVFSCPKRYWFVEDLWLSYVLDQLPGWRLYKSAAEIEVDADQYEQYRFLLETKDRLFRYLVRRGWDPLLPTEESAQTEEVRSSSSFVDGAA